MHISSELHMHISSELHMHISSELHKHISSELHMHISSELHKHISSETSETTVFMNRYSGSGMPLHASMCVLIRSLLGLTTISKIM